MAKRKNQDVTYRQGKRGRGPAGVAKKEVTSTQYSTIRVSLNSVWVGTLVTKLHLEQYVYDGNKLQLEAWVLFNAWVCDALANGKTLHEPSFNQSACYQFLRQATKQGSTSELVPGLDDVAKRHRAARAAGYESVDGRLFTAFAQNASRQMSQNIQVRPRLINKYSTRVR